MKFSSLASLAIIISTPSYATEAPEAACRAQITKNVIAAATLLGVKQEIGFDLAATGETDTTYLGESLDEYATSAFIIQDGYVTGSGARIAVKPVPAGCEVVRLEVRTR